MGADIVGERWSLLIVREMLTGADRFNDIHRGLPNISRTLLSKRLQTLQHAGLVERTEDAEGQIRYHVTDAGADLRPVLEALGAWTVRWRFPEPREDQLNAHLLLWRMRAGLVHEALPKRRVVIEFLFDGKPAEYGWLILDGENSSICARPPAFDVDLYARASSKTWHEAWHGHQSVDEAIRNKDIELLGDVDLAAQFPRWFGLSRFVSQVAELHDASS
jgi:DNA-binding HxlR family transcriptional regulator